MTQIYQHTTVLLEEAVAALIGSPDGYYIDGTFGRGGHSQKILGALSGSGRLLGIDKDPQAYAAGCMLSKQDARFVIEQASFSDMAGLLDQQGLTLVDGILLDLGVSSPQLDQPERGFSFQSKGPLDMRMNPAEGISAQEWINSADADDMARVFKEYGEERFAKRIAQAIVSKRALSPIVTTLEFANIIAEAHPSWEKGKHPATRVFQATRIYINNELGDLVDVLEQAIDLLAVGGRLVVISFHSLEDRLVKRFIQRHEKGDELPSDLPVTADCINQRLKRIGKVVKPSEEEVAVNPRARSAVMRIAQKVA